MHLPLHQRSRALGILVASAITTMLASSCSLVGDFDGAQCASSIDCELKGPEFATRTMCEQGVCVAPPSVVVEPPATTPQAVVSCTSNKDCSARQHLRSICAKTTHECVNLQSADCPLVYGDDGDAPASDNDNAIVIGAFAYLDNNPATTPAALSIKLAVDQINAAKGIPPAGPGLGHRPLVAVVCNKASPSRIMPAAQHLVDEVKTAAIVGQIESAQLSTLMTELAVPKDVLVMATLANDKTLRDLNTNGLLWHAIGDVADLGRGVKAALTWFGPKVRTDPKIGPAMPLRVALVASESVDTSALAAKLKGSGEEALEWDGKRAALHDPATFTEVRIPPLYGTTAACADTRYGQAVSQLLAFRPHVIVGAAADELAECIIPKVEQSLPAPAAHWIATSRTRYNVGLYDRGPFFASRFIGVDFAGNKELHARYAQDLRTKFQSVIRPEGYNYLYDAVYAIALAVHAAGDVSAGQLQLHGSDVARGLRRISQPAIKSVAVGTSDAFGNNPYLDGIGVLTASGDFQLVGTTGAFDVPAPSVARTATGISLFCIGVPASPAPGQDPAFRFDELTLSSGPSGSFNGAVSCF